MAINDNDQQENEEESGQFEGNDPVATVKEKSDQGKLSQAKAELRNSIAQEAVKSITGIGGKGKFKNIRQIIRFTKGTTAVGGSIGDIFLSIPIFVLVGVVDILLSYLVPGWEIDKFEKLFTILFLAIFGIVIISMISFLIGFYHEICVHNLVVVDANICEIFL